MFERQSYQPAVSGAIPPPDLQPQMHDHMIADHVPKSRRAGRPNQNLSKGIMDVYVSREGPSSTPVLMSPNQHS